MPGRTGSRTELDFSPVYPQPQRVRRRAGARHPLRIRKARGGRCGLTSRSRGRSPVARQRGPEPGRTWSRRQCRGRRDHRGNVRGLHIVIRLLHGGCLRKRTYRWSFPTLLRRTTVHGSAGEFRAARMAGDRPGRKWDSARIWPAGMIDIKDAILRGRPEGHHRSGLRTLTGVPRPRAAYESPPDCGLRRVTGYMAMRKSRPPAEAAAACGQTGGPVLAGRGRGGPAVLQPGGQGGGAR